MNHYAVLGIDETASLEDIKVSYKNLSKRFHPNSNSGEASATKFIELKKSYDYLIKYHIPKVKINKPPREKVNIEGEERYFRVFQTFMSGKRRMANVPFPEKEFKKPTTLHMMADGIEFKMTMKAETKLPNTVEVFNVFKDQTLTLNLIYQPEDNWL